MSMLMFLVGVAHVVANPLKGGVKKYGQDLDNPHLYTITSIII